MSKLRINLIFSYFNLIIIKIIVWIENENNLLDYLNQNLQNMKLRQLLLLTNKIDFRHKINRFVRDMKKFNLIFFTFDKSFNKLTKFDFETKKSIWFFSFSMKFDKSTKTNIEIMKFVLICSISMKFSKIYKIWYQNKSMTINLIKMIRKRAKFCRRIY